MILQAPAPKNNGWIYLIILIVSIIIIKNISDKVFKIKSRFDISTISTVEKVREYEAKNIIESSLDVDSLLVVVESLTVQVDSLHLQANGQPTVVYIPSDVDTTAIITNYFKTYSYTIKHKDKDINLKVNFDYQGNNIYSPVLEYKILRPTKITYRPLRGWFYGGTVGGSIERMHQVTPEIMYIKNKHAYKIGYNLLGSSFNIQLGYYIKF